MPRYKPREEPRNQFRKFRVNEQEGHKVDALAKRAGMRVSDYLRSLVNLPALAAGAPLGNKNRAKKR